MAIGTALRIKVSKLREIEKSNKDNYQACLRNTMVEFVNMNYDVKKHGEPTWRKIVRAVEHQAGGNNRAHAIVIAKDHLMSCKLCKYCRVGLSSALRHLAHTFI